MATKSENSATPGADTRAINHLDDASMSGDSGRDKEALAGLSKWQKVKQHFRRFWWIYVIVVVVSLAILLPITFKVIIPAIIRNVVRNQELPVRGGALNFTAPTHLNMTLDTSLNTPLGVKIDPLPLSLYQPPADPDVDDADAKGPFITLQMPEQHVHHETEVTIPEQVVQVLNQTQITAWFNDFFDKETVNLRLKANDMSAHLGALHYVVDLDKTVLVPGLNYLKGFSVQDMQFSIPADPLGRNMKGHLVIPNAGVITLGMGNISFNVMAGDINLGLVHVYDFDLKPGNNTPFFDGEFYFDQLVPNLAAVLDSQRDALAEGMLELHAAGNSTINYGQHIKYIEGVLNLKRIPFRIPVTTLLLDVVSGVLAGGTNGTEIPLLDTLGDVLGNRTLFEQMLGHFYRESNESSANGVKAGNVERSTTTLGRTLKMNLLRLGLSGLRSKIL